MLSKCANPDCSTPLLYLREGKVFKLEVNDTEAPREGLFLIGNNKIPPRATTKVEHFWLCGPCSQRLTLYYDKKDGLMAVPRMPMARRAVAS